MTDATILATANPGKPFRAEGEGVRWMKVDHAAFRDFILDLTHDQRSLAVVLWSEIVARGGSMPLLISRLAYLLNTSPKWLNRVIRELQGLGRIEVADGQVTCPFATAICEDRDAAMERRAEERRAARAGQPAVEPGLKPSFDPGKSNEINGTAPLQVTDTGKGSGANAPSPSPEENNTPSGRVVSHKPGGSISSILEGLGEARPEAPPMAAAREPERAPEPAPERPARPRRFSAPRTEPRKPLPATWAPCGEVVQWAENKGFKPDDILQEAEQFRLYNLARGSRMADWQSTFRMWLSKAVVIGQDTGAGVGPRKHGERYHVPNDPNESPERWLPSGIAARRFDALLAKRRAERGAAVDDAPIGGAGAVG